MLCAVYNGLDLAHDTRPAGITAPLGVEVQQTTFAFDEPGPLENTVFVRFKIWNRSSSTIESLYAGVWSDPDVGGATDDLVGCDVSRSLGLAYNADWTDTEYGSVPPA